MTQAPDILKRARPEILAMQPYPSARSLVQGDDKKIYLDANELYAEPLPGTHGLGRYLEQQPKKLIQALAELYGVTADKIMAARGADEVIDLIVRVFCNAGHDNLIICPPTFPVYAFAAQLQGAEIRNAPLRAEDFSVDESAILKQVDQNTKILFLCTPNNPTSNCVPLSVIENLCTKLAGQILVVVDEAYIEFANQPSAITLIDSYPNLVVLRTLSKAYALAGARCGCMIANSAVTALCRRVLQIYPIPAPTMSVVMETLQPANKARLDAVRQDIVKRRNELFASLQTTPDVVHVYPSESNFFLVKFKDASRVMDKCAAQGIVLRNQSKFPGLNNCIRIAIGSREEMDALMAILRSNTP
jgi:histidinol-phosphate aminotransferase